MFYGFDVWLMDLITATITTYYSHKAAWLVDLNEACT